MNFAGFDRPKVRKKKILCLYSPSLKVHGTKTSGPLRFSAKESDCFYLRAAKHKFSFEKSPVGINTLNAILPNMCKEAGINRETAHSLGANCLSH